MLQEILSKTFVIGFAIVMLALPQVHPDPVEAADNNREVRLPPASQLRSGEIRRGPDGKLYLAPVPENTSATPPPATLPTVPRSLPTKQGARQMATPTQGVPVELSWDAPTTNTDGTLLKDLAGYKLYYGQASKKYDSVIDVGNSTSHTLFGLMAGNTYFFAVRAYDFSGKESAK